MFGGTAARLSRAQAQKAGDMVTRHLAALIAEGELPFSFVELHTLRALLRKVCPWYTMPSRTTMARKVVPSLFRATRDRVKECLSRAQAQGRGINFTSDIWTCPHSQNAYLSLTAHWWDPSELHRAGGGEEDIEGLQQSWPGHRRALLAAEVLSVSHTGENISEAIRRQIAQWDIERDSIGFLVTDGGSNMRSAASKLGVQRISCAAHLLNLVVKDALGDSANADADYRNFSHILAKCRAIVAHFHRSPRDTLTLRQKQTITGVPEHRLIVDVSTRWNSTYDMLVRLVEQRSALDAFFLGNRAILPEHQLDDEEWSAVAQAVKLLAPFKEQTETLSGEAVNLAVVILMYKHVLGVLAEIEEDPDRRASLVPAVRVLARRLRNGMESRFGELVRSDTYMLASMCDPALKGDLAEEFGLLDTCRELLCSAVRELQEMRGTVPCAGRVGQERGMAPVSGQPATQGPVPPKTRLLLHMYGTARHSGRRVDTELGTAESMVGEYLRDPPEPETTDPLTYWATKERIWPELSLVAQRYLSCPPTSVASERVFSVAGDIVSPHRSRLLPWKVEQLTFLKVNCPLFGIPSADTE